MGESIIEQLRSRDMEMRTARLNIGAHEKCITLQNEGWKQRAAWSWDWDWDYLHNDTIHVGILSLYGIYFPAASRRADNSA